MRPVVHLGVAWWEYLPDVQPVIVVQLQRLGLEDALRARLRDLGFEGGATPRVTLSRHTCDPQAGCWVQEEEEIEWN